VTCDERAEWTVTSPDACCHLTAADVGGGARVPRLCPRASAASDPIFSRPQTVRLGAAASATSSNVTDLSDLVCPPPLGLLSGLLSSQGRGGTGGYET
jgi:hypothetical protein